MAGVSTVLIRWLYVAVVAAVACERLVELRISRRHMRRALAAGGIEVGAAHYPWMVALHASFLLACPLEVFFLSRPFLLPLALCMLAALIGSMALRYWTIATLGERWTTRVVWVPGRQIAVNGPFRWLRHPNYLAVAVEMLALPLLHSAWLTALFFSLANALLLRVRVRDEEELLRRCGEYGERLGARPRFLPRGAG
jgi:methyltransferase